jgi:hypothetical protein
MGEQADALVDFLSDIPAPSTIARDFANRMKNRNELLCKHDIIADWCHECKHLSKGSIKQVLLTENLAITENLLSWMPENVRRTILH